MTTVFRHFPVILPNSLSMLSACLFRVKSWILCDLLESQLLKRKSLVCFLLAFPFSRNKTVFHILQCKCFDWLIMHALPNLSLTDAHRRLTSSSSRHNSCSRLPFHNTLYLLLSLRMSTIQAEEPCPIDGRRTSKELYVKLLVVHFTVLTAYCHLLSLRNERVLSWRPLYFFITPFNIIAQHAAALVVIVAGKGFALLPDEFGRIRLGIRHLKSPFSWLLGDTSEMATGSSNATGQSAGRNIPQTRPSASKTVGRTLVVIAFETQCIGAIVLYARRRKHDAVTHVDERIFELACGGLLVGILILGVTIRLQVFHRRIPDIPRSRFETVIFWLRSCALSPPSGSVSWYEPQSWKEFLKENLVSLAVIIASGRFVVFASLKAVFRSGFLDNLHPTQPDRYKYWAEGLTWIVLLVFVCLLWIAGDDPFAWAAHLDVLLIILGFGSFMPVYLVAVRDCVRLFRQIGELGSWPVDVTCPLLWSDPYANYIWWLA
ncbi:hypothetical protein BKA64DRAFT_676180 [Cadophora sp. MPI-SDFR-AT-0126]|nr:hypothetical protein BKA64DRAFT_676180 [Leotiomycetes sp. MPI-SDFR-AT-0126]